MKFGRNDPCWCGSGRKYKHCHLGRATATPRPQSAVIAAARKAFQKKLCLCPANHPIACSGGIIRAHTISKRAALDAIAVNGHVGRMNQDIGGLFAADGQFRPISVGINEASTFTGFCSAHDTSLFRAIDTEVFDGSAEQCFLLGYRSIAREYYGKAASLDVFADMVDSDAGKALIDQVEIQAFCRQLIVGTESSLVQIARHRTAFDNVLLGESFDSVHWAILEFSSVPEIACSGSFFPDVDFHGNTLQDIENLSCDLDLITYHIFSAHECGFAVFSWLADSDRSCLQFVRSLLDIPAEGVPSALLRFAFEYCDNTYWQPTWWAQLEPAVRNRLVARVANSAHPLTPIAAGHARDDGFRPVQWRLIRSTASFK